MAGEVQIYHRALFIKAMPKKNHTLAGKEKGLKNEIRLNTIIEALQDGEGRVRAVKKAGIHYETFIRWMNEDEAFAENVMKAEITGADKIKDVCKRRIIEDRSWQSAAWWLERNYPNEYKNRSEVNVAGNDISLNFGSQTE